MVYDNSKSEKGVIVLNRDMFLTKMHWFATGAFIPTPKHPEPCDARFNMDARTYFYYFYLLNKKKAHVIIKLERARTIFDNSDWIRLKEESLYT